MSLEVVDQLLQALDRVRKEAPDLPMQQLQVFLTVARNEGMSMIEVQELCGLTNGAGYRNIHALMTLNEPDREGRDWIYFELNPKNKRQRRLYLTEKGRRVLNYMLLPLKRAK